MRGLFSQAKFAPEDRIPQSEWDRIKPGWEWLFPKIDLSAEALAKEKVL